MYPDTYRDWLLYGEADKKLLTALIVIELVN